MATNTYNVSGGTLEDVWNSIQANSPNPGRAAGYAKCEVIGFRTDGEPVVDRMEDPSCPGGFRYKVSITRTIVWSIKTTITLPKWADGYTSACAEVRAEWDRFLAALTTHEEGHDRVAEEALTNANPLTTIIGMGSDCDRDTAIANARADLEAKYSAEAQRVSNIVKAASDQYDDETDDGATQGAVLDGSVGCPEEPEEPEEEEDIGLNLDSLPNLVVVGRDAPSQSFEIWTPPGMTLTYLISDNADWLECSPTTGTSTGEHDLIVVNYQTSSLVAGDYSTTITITGQLISNPPETSSSGGSFTMSVSATIPVILTIAEPSSVPPRLWQLYE